MGVIGTPVERVTVLVTRRRPGRAMNHYKVDVLGLGL